MSLSWGNYPIPTATTSTNVLWQHQSNLFVDSPVLAYGNGRSYGDQCHNSQGTLLNTRTLNRLIAFDAETGLLEVEAGCLLSDILAFANPRGWTLPVMPGTQYITVGGAIANDVHGKNHHLRGNFGHHIQSLLLLRSDGTRLHCSDNENSDMFCATIGGIGLTGLILSAQIQLIPMSQPYIDSTTVPFNSLAEFFELSQQAENDNEFTVAWLDCINQGAGRGLFSFGNYCQHTPKSVPTYRNKKRSIPCNFPSLALNPLTIKCFNHLYFNRGKNKGRSISHFQPFLFPLDSLLNWNRIYGKRGFLQYQCVVPREIGQEAVTDLLKSIVKSKQGSFLSVLKCFGKQASKGMLSFPRPGVTLALDFPNRGDKTLKLLNQLDEIVMAAKGHVYLAKDARLSPDQFNAYYGEQVKQFEPYKDPAFQSDLWLRVSPTS